MSYLAFALKYRPQNFDEVVGQEQVVVSLKNAIEKERVHHAYLFSGPRGVGKTSLARIFAKSLNCQKGPTINPCGKCPSCLEINRGTSLDIIEIDGASNRGIDDIRTLRENVKLSPAHSRYKIYIIDEVHQITTDGFNALLKTLEEPPAHVKFIFATTHPQKVIPTILSRCQKFSFHLISVDEIVAKLKKIAKSEKLKIEDSLFYAVSRAAGGSIRDAESLLDQLAPVILEKGAVKDVFSFLGIIDEETLNSFLKSVINKNLSQCIDFIDKTVKEGKDLGVFISSLLEHLRHLLLAKVSMKAFKELSDISPASKQFILDLSKSISASQVLKIIDLLIEAKDLSRKLNTMRIPLELAIVKSCYQEKENMPKAQVALPEVKTKPQPVQPPKPKNPPAASNLKDDLDLEDEDFDLDDTLIPVPEKKPVSQEIESEDIIDEDDVAEGDDYLLTELKTRWPKIISDIQRTRAAIASHLSYARPVSSRGSVLAVGFNEKDSFHKEIVGQNKNARFVEEAISRSIGKPVRVKFVISKEVSGLPQEVKREKNQPAGKKETPKESMLEESDDFINDLLDAFGGKIHTDND